jgi:hypothetical protein
MSFFEKLFPSGKKPESVPENEQEKQTSNMERQAEFTVRQLSVPVQRIMEKLSPVLESGEIQLIIGDDASGRIPTAIFRKIFDMAYKERGFITPETRFIAGSAFLQGEDKEEKKKKITEYFKRVKSDVEKKFGRTLGKAIIVTDTVVTGVSLDPMIEVLHEMGVQTTIASIGVLTDEKGICELEERWSSPPPLGGMEHTPSVYASETFSGVFKKPRDLFAQPFAREGVVGKFGQKGNQKMINKTRELGDLVAEEAYEKWKMFRNREETGEK